MRSIQNAPALAASLIIILVAAIIFALNIMSVSVTDETLGISSTLLTDSVKIYRNENNIPHIVAKNERDAFFSIGYCHAQDRLWQIDFTRRAARGRLSEILGEKTVETDIFMRALGLNSIADSLWKTIDGKSKSILQAYSDGVNAYIETHEHRLPFEFGALDYTPDKWLPTDCLTIARAMAFELSLSFWADVAFGEIALKIKAEKALDLIPSYPDYAPCVTDEISRPSAVSSNVKKKRGVPGFRMDSCVFLTGLGEKINRIREMLGIKGSSLGSNSWAVRKKKDAPSGAVLANDPHLGLGLPPRWHQAHISSPGMNVVGLTIPGTPLFLSGRNDNIAWGATNIMADDCDFFIVLTDSINPDYYMLKNGGKKKFDYFKDTIIIRGAPDSVYYVRRTDRSNVISDFHLFHNPDIILDYSEPEFRNSFLHKYSLTFSWTATHPSDEILALYKINRARNWKEFLAGTALWGSPGLNFTYADVDGNIGISPAGRIPKRQKRCNPDLPNPTWLDEYDWDGLHPAGVLPPVYNPPKQFVASANNKIVRELAFFVSSHWEPPSRAERIETLLDESDEYSAREAQLMQMDLLSPYSERLLHKTLPIIEKDSAKFNELERAACGLLRDWDNIHSAAAVAPSIFNAFLESFVHNTFHDELGERLYREYALISSLPLRRIMEFVEEGRSVWFDDVFTNQVESFEDIVMKSFLEAVEKLAETFDDEDVAHWRYGEIHTLTLKHILSEQRLLEPTVTLGPFPVGGNVTTINNTEWRLFAPFDMTLGASMRFIADMEDSVIYTSLPGGSSGDPLSPHYGDQTQLWLNGGYLTLPAARTPGERFELSVELYPIKQDE